ncbi:hypothetical protein HWV62_16356 [Athelia sp. TMB]|nr:hypothetical protein HWV62_16356 [Athelia sp. TMB]
MSSPNEKVFSGKEFGELIVDMAQARVRTYHPPDAITTNLPPEKHLGNVDLGTVEKVEVEITDVERARQERLALIPPLEEILNLHDFEAIAKLVMAEKAWAYYSSAADDEITIRENHAAFHRIWFRPRVMRDVSKVDYSTTIFGQKTSMPVYITATALGKLGHKDGELNLTRAAAKHDVVQMIPTLASCAFDEIVDAAIPGQSQYVNSDRAVTKRIVQHAEERGIKALFITVDAPQLGRREKDMRQKYDAEDPAEQSKAGGDVDRSQGAARAISDALEAYDQGLAGVVLSNHGGRQLDFARSGIEILVEVVTHLKEKRGLTFPNDKFLLFVDGGVRRATDVLKAIALGATSVGVGRPFLYAFSAYGTDGVNRALQILKDEFEMNLRLLGAPTLKDVVPSMVDASNVHTHIVAVPGDNLYNNNCELKSILGAGLARRQSRWDTGNEAVPCAPTAFCFYLVAICHDLGHAFTGPLDSDSISRESENKFGPTFNAIGTSGIATMVAGDFNSNVDRIAGEYRRPSSATRSNKTSRHRDRPKPALGAWMFFAQDWRDRIKAENPEATFAEIGRLLGAKWKELDEDEKWPYVEIAAKDKSRAEKERAVYDAGVGMDDDEEAAKSSG